MGAFSKDFIYLKVAGIPVTYMLHIGQIRKKWFTPGCAAPLCSEPRYDLGATEVPNRIISYK